MISGFCFWKDEVDTLLPNSLTICNWKLYEHKTLKDGENQSDCLGSFGPKE